MRHLQRKLALVVVLSVAAACGETSGRPNVLLIVVDTLRADVLDDGERVYDTPALDALAAEGVAFSRAFAHAPMTLPSHTALFSSRVPAESGVVNNEQLVPTDLPLLAEWMRDHGYRTRGVVSLGTMCTAPSIGGLDRGFETYGQEFRMHRKAEDVQPEILATLSELDEDPEGADKPFFLFAHYSDPHEPYRSHGTAEQYAKVLVHGRDLATLRLDDGPQWFEVLQLPAGLHRMEIISNELFRCLAVTVKGPTRDVEVTFPDVGLHSPTQIVTAEFETDGEEGANDYRVFVWLTDEVSPDEIRTRYAKEVAHADRYVGGLLDELRARDLYDDTLIVFVSDHGESLMNEGERGHIGHVRYLYDPLIRVPLVIKPPARSSFGESLESRRNEPVSLVDVAPTILSMCGLPELPGQRGFSLVRAERDGPFEHVAQTHKPEAPQDRIAIRDGRFKMVYVADDDTFAMYDLEADPLEAEDRFAELSLERPDWAERLRTIAETSAALRQEGGLSEEAARMLEALGYGGDG